MARKYSRKREAIIELLRMTDSHPSAESIYNELKSEFPDLSLGTVYRNLGMFKEEGTIITVGNVDGQDRYDADVSDHAHFFCGGCSAIIDINTLPLPESVLDEVGRNNGMDISGYRLEFYGLCDKCRNHRNKQEVLS